MLRQLSTRGSGAIAVACTLWLACRSSAPAVEAPEHGTLAPAAVSASVPSPDPCGGLGVLGDDAVLSASLQRCTQAPIGGHLARAPLGAGDFAVWVTLSDADGGAPPPENVVANRRVLLARIDAKDGRVEAWTIVDQPAEQVMAHRARVEQLAGSPVLVERLETVCLPSPAGPTPCPPRERVWLVRGSALVQGGTYAMAGAEPRGPKGGDPERGFETTDVRYHDDRIDLHDAVTWTWYERKYTDILGFERRAVRQSTSTYDRSFVLRGATLTEDARPADSPPEPHPVHDAWH